MLNGNLAYLLDINPVTWTSREELHARLCSALRSEGNSPVLIVAEEPAPAVRARLEGAGAVVCVLPYPGPSPGYVSKLRRIIEAHRISVVHIRYFDYFSALPWVVRACGVRRVLFTDANGGSWRPRTWTAPLLRLRTRIAMRPLTRTVAISGFVKARLTALGASPDKIVTICNGIDLDQYRPDTRARGWLRQTYGIRPEEVVISTIAGLRALKHPEIPVEAVHLLAGAGLPVKLIAAGDGPMRSELHQMAERLRVAGRIVWLGHYPEPWKILQGSDIFTLATDGEAFGFVVAEAMACGVPVVGARSGAIPELVEDGRTGFLAAPGDARDFADKLRPLIEDADLREKMGRVAIERAGEFGIDRTVSKTIALYHACAADAYAGC